jgi:hypothetical protein
MKIQIFGLTLLLMIFAGAADTADGGHPARPNIVLMMADDMGLGDTRAYLGVRLAPNAEPMARSLRTPNLDSFAREGLLFTDAYAPASMCSSTRYSVLTGRFSHRSYLKYQGRLPHGPNTPMIRRELNTTNSMIDSKWRNRASLSDASNFCFGYPGLQSVALTGDAFSIR